MMEYIVVALFLSSLVVGEEMDTNDNIYKIDEIISTITNQTNLKEPGLTLLSYIDRLECGVEKSWKGNIFTESCSTLKQMGVNETGLYLLNDQGIAYCDMSKDWNDSNIQTGVGRLRFKDVV